MQLYKWLFFFLLFQMEFSIFHSQTNKLNIKASIDIKKHQQKPNKLQQNVVKPKYMYSTLMAEHALNQYIKYLSRCSDGKKEIKSFRK